MRYIVIFPYEDAKLHVEHPRGVADFICRIGFPADSGATICESSRHS